MSLKSTTSFDVINNYNQYRSFDRLYLFKTKKNDNLNLKIFDISQKRLFKKTFSVKDLKKIDIYRLFIKGRYSMFLEALVQKQLLNSQYLPNTERVVSLQDCLRMAKETIQQFKPNIFVEPEELKDFFCPITLGLFSNPVIDDHGHTFEKEAIENYFGVKKEKECPINRQPIKSLTPNRILRQTIEEWKKKDPIPNFSLFKKENAKLAQSSLQMAKDYIEGKEYKYALESYAKAFKFTKNWKDYETLPVLFTKMGEVAKTTLAYLYLASYQLEDKQIVKATRTLEKCPGVDIKSPINFLLFNLYELSNQSEKAFILAVQMAKNLSKLNPKQAIIFYKKALRIKPDQFDLYFSFSQLLKTPRDKAHILLKGTHCAMNIRTYEKVESLCQESYKYSKSSFVDQVLYLQLLHKQQKFTDIKSRLFALAMDYEKRNLFIPMLKAYKMLFQIEKKSAYCQKIILAYNKLQKTQKQMRWYLGGLFLLIEEKKWKEAEEIALEALTKANDKDCLFIYKKLEKVYTNWHEHELENLWGKLGQFYIKNNQLTKAEKVYRKAIDRFSNLDHVLQLASLLVRQNKKSEGVKNYYKASFLALLNKDLKKLALCTHSIRQVDPKMLLLKANQRMHLLTHTTILALSKELQKAKNKNILLERKILSLEKLEIANKIEDLTKKWQETNKRNILLDNEVSSLRKKLEKTMKNVKEDKNSIEKLMKAKRIKEKRKEDLLKIPFGKAEWMKYFGDVGVEPPLPSNIMQILKGPCPIWSGKRVADTHLLVLIPAKVNGQSLTLNSLEELIKKPKTGHSTKYRIGGHYTRKEFGNKSISSSYWIFFSKDVIFESRKKSYTDQCKSVKELSRKISITMPTALEAAVAISTHYVRSGERLYSDNPSTSTRCKDTLAHHGWPVVVGAFSLSKGFIVHVPETHNQFVYNPHGMAVVRKF